ncbi:MAG TPA: aldehyde dehydrogenase [Methanocorpusculum sp.]|nr:aldehyde dehydrogenase [Methanocorpusculum sp.]
MDPETIESIVRRQQAFFAAGNTLDIGYRQDALAALNEAVSTHEEAIAEALYTDLGKSACESFMTETGFIGSEITYLQKHLRSWAKDRKALTPLAQFAAKSFVRPMPYGSVLIMSPWNYPVLLTLEPLADAIAAGNCVVLKPSAYSPASSSLIKKIIEEIYPPEYVSVITGGRDENTKLLDQKFDYIFFTGSKSVGKIVLEKAARHLTPVTLELGGKSPCYVDASADIPLAAKRIVFGKLLNCGQTCIAPDYILAHESVKDELISHLKSAITAQYSAHPLENPAYGKIISPKHFDRIQRLIDPSKVVFGGICNAKTCRIEPTILDNVTEDDAVMQEEIFGPIIPVLTVKDAKEAVLKINTGEKPLALYVFAEDRQVTKLLTTRCAFGGGCINDTIIHIATSRMGFGGTGESGMGSYHGSGPV